MAASFQDLHGVSMTMSAVDNSMSSRRVLQPQQQHVESFNNNMKSKTIASNNHADAWTSVHLSKVANDKSQRAATSPSQVKSSNTNEPATCGECMRQFENLQLYLVHECSHLQVATNNSEATNDEETDNEKGSDDESLVSDVETFEGKIIYQQDGSAFIIEADDMDNAESLIPHKEGAIIDQLGVSNESVEFPRVLNAFHISRTTFMYDPALYGQSSTFQNKERFTEAPVVHGYRVKDTHLETNCESDSGSNKQENNYQSGKNTLFSNEYTSVPTKPILMCFICKLSFGYAKSFTSHAKHEHQLTLSDNEWKLMNQGNFSAIIQGTGKEKQPLMSFLEPSAQTSSTEQSATVETSLMSSSSDSSVCTSIVTVNADNSFVALPAAALPCDSQKGSDPTASASHPMSDQVTKEKPSPGMGNLTDKVTDCVATEKCGKRIMLPERTDSDSENSASSKSNDPVSPSHSGPCSENSESSSADPDNSLVANNITSPVSPMQSNALLLATPFFCTHHPEGKINGIECPKCDLLLSSNRSLGGHMSMMHSRNSCKTLKCPKCNWHYKYQETLEIHMKEKHPDSETTCTYCLANRSHPRLARGETYSCGYKPYRCEICNYSTTTKGNLSIHMQSDKHVNNVTEMQNGSMPENFHQAPPSQSLTPLPQVPSTTKMESSRVSSEVQPPRASINKHKPSWRCDVCNYETNVARNLRIHMTSEKHTHNMMILQQNVKHMQRGMQLQLNQAAALQSEQLFGSAVDLAMAAEMGQQEQMSSANGTFASDLLVLSNSPQAPLINKSSTISMATSSTEQSAKSDNTSLFQCCICNVYSTDNMEDLHKHLQKDRTKNAINDSVLISAGSYICKLCLYKTNLKANFQLHCKTDKHLQKVQLVNHVREGGPENDLQYEYHTKYPYGSIPVQVRCDACCYETTSLHKFQVHISTQLHAMNAQLFRNLIADEKQQWARYYYHCSLCDINTQTRSQMMVHSRTGKHFSREAIGEKSSMEALLAFFSVRELKEEDRIVFEDEKAADGDDNNKVDTDSSTMVVKTEKEADDKSMLKQVLLDPNDQSASGDTNSVDVDQLYVCPYCNYSSPNEVRIRAHVLAQHTQRPKSLTCPLCQDEFQEMGKLEKHLIKMHNVTTEGMQRLLMMVEKPDWMASSVTGQSVTKEIPENNNTQVNNENSDEEGELVIDTNPPPAAESIDTEEYRCQMCARMFVSIDDLYDHQNEQGHLQMQQGPRGPGYLCWKKGCNQYFKTAHLLRTHFREIHDKKQQVAISERHLYKYRCNQCSLAFKTLEKLQGHSQYHAIRAATCCMVCGRSFRSVAALRRHMETMHTDMTPADVEQCNAALAASLSKVVMGMEAKQEPEDDETSDEVNEENADTLPSDSEQSENKEYLEDLKNSPSVAEENYNDPSRKYKCHKCKVAFTKQCYLTSHNKTLLHRKGEKLTYPMEKYLDPNRPYKCDVCKESFTQKNILLVHYNSVSHLHKLKRSSADNLEEAISPTEEDKKPYKCNICKASYTQSSTLDIHMRSVLHQTRASKLQELALTGKVDLSQPLIESPDMQKSQAQLQHEHKKILAEMLLTKQNLTPCVSSSHVSIAESTPSSSQSSKSFPIQTSTNVVSSVANLVSPMISSSGLMPTIPVGQLAQPAVLFPSTVFSCHQCNSVFVSQESLMQHQKFFCLPQTSNNQASSKSTPSSSHVVPEISIAQPTVQQILSTKPCTRKAKPSVHKRLLEGYGFEIVMQFNENRKKRKPEERKPGDENVGVKATAVDSNETSNKINEPKADSEESVAIDNKKITPPELAKSKCQRCCKEFSSIWVLKAHREIVHKETVPMKDVEEFSEVFKSEFDKKLMYQQQSQIPETSIASSAEVTLQQDVSATPATSAASETTSTPQIQQQSFQTLDLSQIPPGMLNLGFNLGFPVNMNMPMLAAMNIPRPLLPMMMSPHVDPLQQHNVQQVTADFVSPTAQQQQQQTSALGSQEQKRARTRINDEQLKVLRAHFDINNSPNEEQIMEMCEMTGLPPKVIKHWFRNTLFKERQRNKDSPYNFNNPPSTTLNLEEYERTGDINIALKAKKVQQDNKKDGNELHQPSLVQGKSESKPTVPSMFPIKVEIHDEKQDTKPPVLTCSSDGEKPSLVTSSTSIPSTISSAPSYSTSSSTAFTLTNIKAEALSQVTSCMSSQPTETQPSSIVPPTTTSPVSPLMSLSPGSIVAMPPPPGSSNALGPEHRSPDLSRRANRTRFTDFQIKMLQDSFEQNAYPKDDHLDHLSKILNLSPRVIVVWFQNARQKARKMYENQPPPEGDQDEVRYKRTPGLNYQCKKCSLVFQRYYELIKHQKTLCYKDEINKPGSDFTPVSFSEGSQASNDTSLDSLYATPISAPVSVSQVEPSVSQDDAGYLFSCEHCNLVFKRFDLWQEHQNIHYMNPSLFEKLPKESTIDHLSSQETMAAKRRAEEAFEDPLSDSHKDKRLRTTILPEQLDFLYQQYQLDSNPSRKMLEGIAHEVGLKKRVVQVWFQNTRARERKGQFRSHHQTIHKRCPFCRALFKARTALESHLATKHADQVSRSEINIDAIPNAEPEAELSQGSLTSASATVGLGSAVTSPMTTFNLSSNTDSVHSTMKRFYEDSLKRYLDELSSPSHKPGLVLPKTAMNKQEGEIPLDLSKPMRVDVENKNVEKSSTGMQMSNNSEKSAEDDRPIGAEDVEHSETFSEAHSMDEDNLSNSGDLNPTSPNSSTGSLRQSSYPKRYRTQMSNLQIKVMKCLFADYKTPTMAECELLGKEIGLPKRVVQVWFQNARAKEKKHKLTLSKQFGQEVDLSHRPPEECKMCKFTYSHKWTIQDHIFTKRHIDNVVLCVQNQEEVPSSSFPEPVLSQLVRQQEADRAAAAMATQQTQMVQQLQAIAGLQSLGISPSAASVAGLQSLHNSVSTSSASITTNTKAITSSKETVTKTEPSEASRVQQAVGGLMAMGLNPLADFPAAALGMGALAASPEMMAYFPYLFGGLNPFAMPAATFMHPAMMPGASGLMAYDPLTHGTPLQLLQVPPSTLHEISQKLAEGNATMVKFSQDSLSSEDLKSSLSSSDYSFAELTDVEVGFVCKNCHLVYPAEALCLNHQRTACPSVGSNVGAILKLVQIQYLCCVCKSSEITGHNQQCFATQDEFKYHCSQESHRKRAVHVSNSTEDSTTKQGDDKASTSSKLSKSNANSEATESAAAASSEPPDAEH